MKVHVIEGNIPLEDFPEIWVLGEVRLKWREIPLPTLEECKFVKTKCDQVDFAYYINVDKYLEHVVAWIKKAKAEKTGFDKFFSLWVAFNAFYRFYYDITEGEEVGEKKQILKTIELLTKSDITIFIQECLPEIQKITQFGVSLPIKRRNHGQLIEEDIMPKLRELVDTNKVNYSREDLETILLALYSIRNSLFHGKKRIIARQDNLLKHAYNVLLLLLSLMLVKYLICYHSGDAPDVLCHCKTRR